MLKCLLALYREIILEPRKTLGSILYFVSSRLRMGNGELQRILESFPVVAKGTDLRSWCSAKACAHSLRSNQRESDVALKSATIDRALYKQKPIAAIAR